MLTVRSLPGEGGDEPLKLGLLYPVPERARDSILLEDRDGTAIDRFVAKSVSSYLNGEQAALAEDTEIGVWITDARIAVACSTYDAVRLRSIGLPPQDLQDLLEGVVDKVVDKALESLFNRIEQPGKMLVAQFRYPWVRSVGSTALNETVALEAELDRETVWRLEIVFPSPVNVAEIAAEVARRAARFRLAAEGEMDAETHATLQELASMAPLASEAKGAVAYHVLPSSWAVTDASAALLGLPADVAARIEAGLETRAFSTDDIIRAIALLQQVETGAIVEDLGPLFKALVAARVEDVDELAPTVAWFADVIADKVPRERREAAARLIIPRLCQIDDEYLRGGLGLKPPLEQELARLLRVWFVTARTLDERIEFLLRYWEDGALADERRGVYSLALVVGAGLIAASIDGALTYEEESEVSGA